MAKKKQASKPKSSTKQVLNCEQISYDNPSIVHNALKHYLGYLLHKTTIIFKAQTAEKLTSLNLQGFHVAALSIIAAEANMNQIQLCSETGVDKATMVKTIDHLEKLGLAERVESKNDRRVKNLIITKKGRQILQQASKIRQDCEENFLSILKPKEGELLKDILLRLIQKN